MSMSITLVARCPDLELQLGNCRLDIWQQLRVIQKQADIVTFAMIHLKHHRGPAAEGPSIQDVTVTVHGINYSEGFFEKIFPTRGRRRHARSVSS